VTTTSAGSTNIYTYHFSPYEINSLPVYAESYTFTGADTITEVSYAYDSPDYFRTQAQMLSARSEAGLTLKLTTSGTPAVYGVNAESSRRLCFAFTSTGTSPRIRLRLERDLLSLLQGHEQRQAITALDL
jgi:hypothetical protein